MKKSTLFIALLALIAPACQSSMQKQMLEDADQQNAALMAENDSTRAQLARTRAEGDALEEQLRFANERLSELEDRVAVQNAAFEQQNAEVDALRARLGDSGVGVDSRGGVIILDLPSSLTFASGKAKLNKKGEETMQLVSDILKQDYPGNTLWIEGHTDNDQPKKSGWESNLELSVERAMSVANYLMGAGEIPSEQVRVSGHGEWKPKADNGTKDGKAANRRVEILVLP
jgi:chemotaxis protein MotB